LRDHLFETLEALKDPEKPMEIDRAKTIAEVAQTIINGAKVEVQFLDVSGLGRKTLGRFFETPDEEPRLGLVNGKKPI
jgi:hypothetical protein